MDSDIEEDYDSVKRNLLEIANNRPGTNVARAISTYNETPGVSSLIMVLEEISKNTDFSTDLRLSVSYYMDEFLRQIDCPTVPRRSIIAAAGNVLQYCGKIYGDRVEFVHQKVENQIEALIYADPKKVENGNNNGNVGESKKPDETRKRRTKKLAQKDFDPFSFQMEPKKFKTLSEEKHFSRTGFETNKNRNRTIEHMYQDHTPSRLWEHEPIIDPDNPYERDDKKNYKLFTYHPEPRYNTLLPDIPFERLNLIKEYVNMNQMDVSDTLHENLSNKEYLDEYIALENQMLASRYGETTGRKATMDDVFNKASKRLHENAELSLVLEDIEEPSPKRRHTEDADEKLKGKMEDTLLVDTLNALSLVGPPETTTIDESPIEEQSALNNTLESNESCGLLVLEESSQLPKDLSELNLTEPDKKEPDSIDLLQIDSGIGMEDVSDFPTAECCAAQSFDDEGVVLTDNIDEQRLQSLSPKVMVHDILPGVPDKANLSVRVDAEMLALSGINEQLEEIVDVPRDVRYPIVNNIFGLPVNRLRRECIFKLGKEYDLFKKARLPSKRVGEPRKPAATREFNNSPTADLTSNDDSPLDWPLDRMEFDKDQNFKGFRRPTYDSGIDHEELRPESTHIASDANSIVDVETEDQPDLTPLDVEQLTEEIQQVRVAQELLEDDKPQPEMLEGIIALDKTVEENKSIDVLPEIGENKTIVLLEDNECDMSATAMDIDECEPGMDTLDEDLSDESIDLNKESTSIDAFSEAKINDWHRRIAPTLEAAHERQNFSIQDVGDEVIRKCQEQDGEATLADVMADKDDTELCRYLLSSLLLTNQGNVALKIDKRDKNEPIDAKDFKMLLLSTERRQLNPEDDIGNVRSSNAKTTPTVTATTSSPIVKSKRGRCNDDGQNVNVKTVRLIKPIPKAHMRPEDADSGISSLPTSASYTNDT
ncbi:uncharacterized protein LOC132787510 isoform X3 [Drosophila nasuta]|uniref:uncharacterized protein LOC132787510 isoform X3 n=1 Tax=Drosophila nasuta TaxID=42062 RepID=UPI00295E4693|nr:uncharacterized protein LOC132787510 isoform X3 [Drosophila nasuta]XP_060650578.1 uncharacterized protein LOC132787510 isoform X3 [Drosophila nasuta]